LLVADSSPHRTPTCLTRRMTTSNASSRPTSPALSNGTGDELFQVAHRHLADPFFGVHLNPGHFIHLDEWPSSPVYAGSAVTLESGMALQLDIIPATGTVYHTSNIEDGVALADEQLRSELAARYPDMWQRVGVRRAFMAGVLGIQLKPEVLPLSNLAGYLPPFWLAPQLAMRRK
jgi:hypothetical protein